MGQGTIFSNQHMAIFSSQRMGVDTFFFFGIEINPSINWKNCLQMHLQLATKLVLFGDSYF